MSKEYSWKTGCDIEATLSVMGGRWKSVILCNLLSERQRFGELCRKIPNATQRMVTLQLRELEADGVIKRHVFSEVPPRVEYELTEFGRSLEPVLAVMRDWGAKFKTVRIAEAQSHDLHQIKEGS
ncbi:MAG: helix-turn-helix domain-containing protein [Aestuariivita sp.]|nr:helix-turn-helix domain-containing protein [Aestuariivita sp.]MCY4203799.1 helix-turn-helix domain-containing protein [Aestuariivita sp.]MCY4288414.1 helix-turn-helix domain-containing protein [Aestuariivita sp.]MCY4345899.1 helix-turn-helix domain-containing protein [Aestuariivita sp.]